jgi:hypothetical protein
MKQIIVSLGSGHTFVWDWQFSLAIVLRSTNQSAVVQYS